MLDPGEQAKDGFRAHVAREQERQDIGAAARAERPSMSGDQRIPLGTLYARFDAIDRGRDKDGDSWAAHVAILDRLAGNRRDAEREGWTSLALERDGGLGRLRLFGVAPDTMLRAVVPDSVSLADRRD